MSQGGQTINNYISGGRGGPGGESHGKGAGGSGGHGIGPRLSFDMWTGGNLTVNNNHDEIQRIDILHNTVALAAIYDSVESFPQPRCHPETRTRMLEDLREWALDADPENTILWLWGPAGAGKSAIMQTLAGQLQDAGRLGGCFFFKRGHATRGNAKTLFATIAYQLALSIPWLELPISQAVRKDPSIVVRSIRTQMDKLISEPCRSHQNWDSTTIMIDGLDECEGHWFQEEILHAIRNLSSDHPTFFRFIIASRPEPNIREVFDSPIYSGSYRSFNVEQSFDDVRTYLCDMFSRIHRQHYTMARIPSPWPSPDVLEKLVTMSSGHFIYASTIIKFIDDKSYRPTDRLTVVLDVNETGSESAFDALDQLYMTILCSAPRQPELIPILCAFANFDLTVATIDHLFGLEDGDARLLLRGLHSVLDVPPDDESRISSYHASFLDFLNNSRRSQNFCAATPDHRVDLARYMLKFCAGQYTKGLVGLFGFGTLQQNLIPFLISLPSSAGLWPELRRMSPDYIFALNSDLQCMPSWLRKGPSAPDDLIKLWEEYACLSSFTKRVAWASLKSKPIIPVRNIGSPVPLNPDIFQVLAIMASIATPLWRVRVLLDITWDELRNIICSCPVIDRDDPGLEVLPGSVIRTSFSGDIPLWAARDAALRCIRTMVKNHLQPGSPRSVMEEHMPHTLGYEIPYLVRLSPPCPVLYRELWSMPPALIQSTFDGGESDHSSHFQVA
ncbi:putative nwd2 protein [Mycena sanguinolenta]|uniref:Putative nwd2 protein n=1 Tax=Mycena sanguinolenta TaxID=230812 RepID=A0A8H6ZDC5_9AGAR|nr:putative nwd2 protein [Mycena sanguinolenta]